MSIGLPMAANCPPKATESIKKPLMWTAPTVISLFALAGILCHLVLRYLLHSPRIAWQAPLILVLIAVEYP